MRTRLSDQTFTHIKQAGFSFIELLISVLIFSVGILGVASLQITSMQMTQEAEQNYIASLLVVALASQLTRENPSTDITFWQQEVSESLPLGNLFLESKVDGYRVTVQWRSSEGQSSQQSRGISEYGLDVVK